MSKKLKIAIFSGEIPSTTFIENLIEGVSQVHQVYLFGVRKKKIKYDSNRIKTFITPYSHLKNLLYTIYRSLRLIFKSPSSVRILWAEVHRYPKLYDRWIWFSKFVPLLLYKPDVIHFQWTRDLEFYSFIVTKFQIPVVVSLRGAHITYTPIIAPYISEIYKQTFPLISSFHAVSLKTANLALNYGTSLDRIKVIHSPVPKNVFSHYEKERGELHQNLRILSISRFHWVKGIRYALDACAILKTQQVPFNYDIISNSNISEEYIFQIKNLGLENEVKILNELPQVNLLEIMKSYDILILPSIEEGIANVVLEAMAVGLPVISTDCGGMSEVVDPGETGWLVPVRNPEAIAQAVIEIKNTYLEVLNRIRKNAHDKIKEDFNYEKSISQFIQLYEQALSE